MKKTSLYNAHERAGARFVDFGGFLMPLQYEGIVKEHLWCRESCSIFDTSHMAKFILKGKEAASELGGIVTADVKNLSEGRCRYCFILNEKGGVVDDAVVYAVSPEEYMLVANAGTKEKDIEWISSRLAKAELTDADTFMDKIDVQGPLSADVLRDVLGTDLSGLSFYGFGSYSVMGSGCIISYSGYTGERGYELYTKREKTEEVWESLLRDGRVKPAGLGARDTLRLEAGLPLYGQDMDEDTTPLEAGMKKFVDFSHDFTGRKALEAKQPEKKIVFLLSSSRQSPRHGHDVFIGGAAAGVVTSGSFSPSLQRGIGIAYVNAGVDSGGARVSTGTEGGAKIDCSVITKKQLFAMVKTSCGKN
ncbi:MAG: glycine cleavage system aminomethyltransferase GcvT [Candidatus Omnitrophica bacterium]|nr:glycine cleavage system aminomethyltransferase GcvT [Candidatus Omnitrophota bacterium]